MRLRASTGNPLDLPDSVVKKSQFLNALDLSDAPNAITLIPTIPYRYLHFAVQYLVDPESAKLLDPVKIKSLPDLTQWVFGYLGIICFQKFYQKMILNALECGSSDLKLIAQLSTDQLMGLSERTILRLLDLLVPDVDRLLVASVDKYQVDDVRIYLQVKTAQNRIVLVGTSQVHVRVNGDLYIDGVHVIGNVSKVYTDYNPGDWFYYITSDGKLYHANVHSRHRKLVKKIPPNIVEFSVDGNGTRLVITREGKVYDNLGLVNLPFLCIQGSTMGDAGVYLLSDSGKLYHYNKRDGEELSSMHLPYPVRQISDCYSNMRVIYSNLSTDTPLSYQYSIQGPSVYGLTQTIHSLLINCDLQLTPFNDSNRVVMVGVLYAVSSDEILLCLCPDDTLVIKNMDRRVRTNTRSSFNSYPRDKNNSTSQRCGLSYF
jgi:hypothetical protein